MNKWAGANGPAAPRSPRHRGCRRFDRCWFPRRGRQARHCPHTGLGGRHSDAHSPGESCTQLFPVFTSVRAAVYRELAFYGAAKFRPFFGNDVDGVGFIGMDLDGKTEPGGQSFVDVNPLFARVVAPVYAAMVLLIEDVRLIGVNG